MPTLPTQTSYEAGWSSATLEYYSMPPGETPEICNGHYAIGVCCGQSFQVEVKMSGVANERWQTLPNFYGGTTLVPMRHSLWSRWQQPSEAIVLNLKSDLLTQNAAELLGVDQIELLPRILLDDPLIRQIALALKADLESRRPGGRLYAETLTNALAVHLVRNYSAHQHKSIRRLGGLSPTQLKSVVDYIHAYLDRELALEELAAIAQLSPYHFCRSFKQSTGLTPHQYLIRQRVERAKLLLKEGKMGILEVALACGFTHQSHLNRHFKRLTGMTPKKFSQESS
ncbi:MAG: AraC family transcriptional regulator [Leptolyngbyaceae cyanobacterium]